MNKLILSILSDLDLYGNGVLLEALKLEYDLCIIKEVNKPFGVCGVDHVIEIENKISEAIIDVKGDIHLIFDNGGSAIFCKGI